jgi:hypothetical protein
MGREDFLAAIERLDISQAAAAERGRSLWPDVDPKTYTDAQRADLLLGADRKPDDPDGADGR